MWRWIQATFFLLSFILATSFITFPFAGSLAGFWPSVIAILLSWIYLLYTGFYYLEATLHAPPGANVFSFSMRYMGSGRAWFSSIIFGITYYCYFIFFFYLGGTLFSEMLHSIGMEIPSFVALLLLTLIVGISVAISLKFTVFLNFLLSLLSAVFVYLCFSSGSIFGKEAKFTEFRWLFLFIVFPTVINSLYYNTFIPTIASFLNYNRKQLQSSIVVALTLASLFFIAWLWLTSVSSFDVQEALNKLDPLSINYASLTAVPFFGKWLPPLLGLNIATTCLGVGAILVDFWGDLLKIPLEERRGLKRFKLCALVFLPPLLLTIKPSRWLFVSSLYITDIGPLYLVGLLPIMWVWSLRYHFQEKITPLVPGGKMMLLFLALLSLFIIYLVGLEIFYQSAAR